MLRYGQRVENTIMKKNGKIKNCLWCGKDMYVRPCEEKFNRQFCSVSCSHTYIKINKTTVKWHNIVCEYCGKTKELEGRFFNKNRRFCSAKCGNENKRGRKNWWGHKISEKLKGVPKSIEHALKVGKALEGRQRLNMRGEKHPNWTGYSSVKELIRKSTKNLQWKYACIKRDNKMCVICGEKNNRKLQVDHIVPFSFIIKSNKLCSLEEAEKCPLLWDINNGRTLCRECHKKTNTYGERAKRYIQTIV